MREVVWFINGWIMPWERRVLLAMAQGLSAKGVTLRALGLKGTSKEWGNVSFANWHFLTGFNKLKWLLYEGKLWHLWGDPPRWWPFVRLRTRVIHTQVEVALAMGRYADDLRAELRRRRSATLARFLMAALLNATDPFSGLKETCLW